MPLLSVVIPTLNRPDTLRHAMATLSAQPDVDCEFIDNEERYRSVGLTSRGRLLSVAWTIRNCKVRAVTAFPATVPDRKAFLEQTR